MIKISKHAQERAKERGISIEQIELTVKEAKEVIDVKFGRKAAFKRFGEEYLVVIYEKRNNEIVVVTTLKVDKKRLMRYGFSRV